MTVSDGRIRQKIKQAIFRRYQKAMQANFAEVPEKCRFFVLTSINGTGEKVGICRFSGQIIDDVQNPRGRVCDSRVSGCTVQAKACKHRTPIYTKEQVKEQISEILSDKQKIGWHFPEVAALMWTLDDDSDFDLSFLDRDPDEPETNHDDQ